MAEEFCYQQYEIQGQCILAICDTDVVGHVATHDKLVINVKESFYCREKCGQIKAKRLFDWATIINATGRRSVDLLLEQGLIDEERILTVEGIPHAQLVKLE